MAKIGRLITAMVTPFTEDGKVDYTKAQEIASYLIENGSDGIVVHGTTGESPTLSHEEEYDLYKAVKEAVGSKGSVIAGTGSNSTDTTIKSTQKAEALGLDAALLVVPYYNRPTQDGLYCHYKAVAQNTSIPLIIYNIPGRTATNMIPETVLRVSEFKNYIGIKESAGDLNQATMIKQILPESFLMWSGDDSLTLPIMSVGGYGVISVASHIAGKNIKEMINSFMRGDIMRAQEINRALTPLFKVLFVTTNPAPLKYALGLLGMNVGIPRLPLVEPNEKEKDIIQRILKGTGFLK